MLPPLPPSLIGQILSHLLPPSLPLPTELVSRSLLDRLAFLPPSEYDIDAHISPFPTDPDQPLSTRLHALARAHEVGRPEYTHDGELHLARILISPTAIGTDQGLFVIFEHEVGERSRGWVYHSTRLWSPTEELEWVLDVEDVKEKHASTTAEQDYWAGFTPPTPRMEAPEEVVGGGEEDYWKQYGEGTGETPDVAGVEPMKPAIAPVPEPTPEAEPEPAKVTPDDSVLGIKLLVRINVALRKMWSAYTRDAGGREDVLVEKALTWLKLAQEDSHEGMSEEDVLRGKMEVLAEMYELVENGGEGGFRRLLEEVIRKPQTAPVETPGEGGQLGYWES